MLATLKEFKTLRDHLRPILDAAETTVEELQELCLPHIRMCGINSLPDELIRKIFEVGYGPQHMPPSDLHFPVEVSQVCRRFRSISLHTPRLWTKLCNLQRIGELEMYIERSKAADLSITIHSSSPKGFHTEQIRVFLALVTKHCNRWSFIHYGAPSRSDWRRDGAPPDLPYTHPAFLNYPNLYLPRLKSMSWRKVDYKKSKDIPPVVPYARWNKPNLVHFEGCNVMADISSLGPNLQSCELIFHSGAWNPRDFLRNMESFTQLRCLTLAISDHDLTSSTDNTPPKTYLTSLRIFHLCLNNTVDTEAVLRFLPSLVMPALSQITVTFGFMNDRGDALRMFKAIVLCAAHSLVLETFTFQYTPRGYPSMANVGIGRKIAIPKGGQRCGTRCMQLEF